jgi:hypothetical protein
MWVNTAVDPLPIQYASFFHADGWEAADLHWRYTYGKVESGVNGVAGGGILGQGIAKANQWNHVAVTVSATEWAVWLNGLKEASRTLTAPATVTLGDGLIGAWLGTDGITISRTFTGLIDDARFYNRALSQEEIASLAAARRHSINPSSSKDKIESSGGKSRRAVGVGDKAKAAQHHWPDLHRRHRLQLAGVPIVSNMTCRGLCPFDTGPLIV